MRPNIKIYQLFLKYINFVRKIEKIRKNIYEKILIVGFIKDKFREPFDWYY